MTGNLEPTAMSLTGIVVRHAINSSSKILTNSPDLIISGASPAFDTASYTNPNAYDWYFSQAPVLGKPNYVYVRGVNYTATGAQTSTVYLYTVHSDQVLDPTKWVSTGITVGGVAQNFVAISAISQYQYVATQVAAMWTPPVPSPSTSSYFLISWVDNTATPKPPVWPTAPFANLDALTAFIQANPTMAVLDTVYRGALFRQFPGQTVGQDGTGAQTSPDIIVNGATAAQNAAAWTGTSSYNPGTPSPNAALGGRNFVYLRAINTATGPATARVYLYWTTTGAIAAPSWQTTYFTYAGQTQNWVDLSASTANEVMISTVPLVWNAPPPPTGQTYVLIAYVDNSGSPQPPDFTAFGYLNPTAVTSFVAGHPQLSWLAITGTPAPQPTMSWEQPIVVGTGSNNLFVGIQLSNIPTDGTLTLQIPGPDAASTFASGTMKIPDPNALIAWPVTYPDHFQTSAVLTYTAGAAPVGKASVVLTIVARAK